MNKLNAKQVCDALNSCDETTRKALMQCFNVDFAVEPTALSYRVTEKGEKKTSALGVINGLVDEPVCALLDGDPGDAKGEFMLLSEGELLINQ